MSQFSRSLFAQATESFTQASGVEASAIRGSIVVAIGIGFVLWVSWVAYGRFRAYQEKSISELTLLIEVLIACGLSVVVGAALFRGLG